jgi:tetratricopeptide (TPR) repeat protein
MRLWVGLLLVALVSLIGAQDILQLFREGERLFRDGKYDEALAAFRKVVELNPDDGEAWVYIGTILLTKRDYDGAIPALEKGLTQSLPPAVAAPGWVNLGVAYQIGRRDLEKAIAAYTKAISLKPDLPEAHFNLILAHLAQNNFSEALKASENAFKAMGKLLRAEQTQATFEQVLTFLPRDYDRALQVLRSLAEQQLPRPEFHDLMGKAYEGLKQFSRAALCYGQAAALAPQVAQYHANFGWALGQMGQWEAAARVLERATSLDAQNAFALLSLGIAYSELGRWQEAARVLNRAVEREPQNWVAHVRLAAAYEQLGDTKKAMQEYLAALGIKEDPAVLNNLARLYLLEGERAEATNQWDALADAAQQAVGRLRRALQLDSNFSVARLNLAIALRQWAKAQRNLGQEKQALDTLQEAERTLREQLKRENNPNLLLELARLIGDQKRWDEAMQLCREVLKGDPRNVDALLLMGYLCVSASRLADAEQAYQQALKVQPQNADAMTGLGIVAYLRGRYDDAIAWFERALKVNPNHPQARQNLEIAKQAKERR